MDRRDSLFQKVIHAGGEARDARGVEGAGLETVRHGHRHLPVLGLATGPAPQQRLDVQSVADPQRARSLGTQEALVAGERDEIGALLGMTDREHARGLRGVDQYDRPRVVSQRRQLTHGRAGS